MEFKEVNATKRGDKWQYRFEGLKKIVIEDGIIKEKRNPITKCGFKTKKEALEAGRRAMVEYYNNDGLLTADMTVNDLFERYINHCKANKYKDSTIQAYTAIIKVELLQNYGKTKLANFNVRHAEDIANKIKISGNATSTINRYINTMFNMFEYAVRKEYVGKNPFKSIDRVKSGKQVNPHRAYSKEEIQKFLNLYKHDIAIHAFIMVAYHAGLRVSEACGLTWDDVNFEDKTITIDKQLRRHKDGFYFESPKCDSYGIIKVDDTLINYLINLKNKLNRKTYAKDKDGRLIDGNSFTFVLTKKDGTNIEKNYLTNKLRWYRVSKKYPVFMLHDLRHTYSTTLFTNGANLKYIQNQMRHKDIQTTLNKYTHLTDETKNTEDEKLNNWFT